MHQQDVGGVAQYASAQNHLAPNHLVCFKMSNFDGPTALAKRFTPERRQHGGVVPPGSQTARGF
jgi:hypothetical protein